jgi:hypothetical protein
VAHKLLAKEEIFEMVRVARAGAIVIMFIMFEDALCHFFAAFRSVCALLFQNNGCICCTVRGDLIRILTKLLARPEKLDMIIIETTGV